MKQKRTQTESKNIQKKREKEDMKMRNMFVRIAFNKD